MARKADLKVNGCLYEGRRRLLLLGQLEGSRLMTFDLFICQNHLPLASIVIPLRLHGSATLDALRHEEHLVYSHF